MYFSFLYVFEVINYPLANYNIFANMYTCYGLYMLPETISIVKNVLT